ncbi:MAG: DUF3313 domain-containing protein [Bacteroidota bacterium]|nr:DUF3313 domain-containing protein [Bacteroidota bacterium]
MIGEKTNYDDSINPEGGLEMKKTLVLLIGIMFLAGCATTAPLKTNFLGEYSKNLASGTRGEAGIRWLKPGVDFHKYKKVMIDYVVFALADDSQYTVVNGDEMKKLGDACTQAIVDAVKDKYQVVAEPGPDVARFRFAIVDLKQSRPALSAVTSVIPVGLGISLVKKGATDSWSGSGATTSQLMVLDSSTNEVIAVAEAQYHAGFTERFSKWGSAEDAFKYWGQRLRKFMDDVAAAKGANK